MAFRVPINGVQVECDTPEEVAQLTRLQANKAPEPEPSKTKELPHPLERHKSNGSGKDGDRVLRAFFRLHPDTQEVLQVLRNCDDFVLTDELVKRSGVTRLRLRSAVRSSQFFFQKLGFDAKKMIQTTRHCIKGKRSSNYRLTDEAKRVLSVMK